MARSVSCIQQARCVIIGTGKRCSYLRACLDSVIVPKLQDYEIILVNDGSTDDSGLIAAEYAGRYPQLIRLITTENGGLGAARNTGLENASGEFVLFLDSDDRLCEGVLQEIMAELLPQRDMILFDFLSVRPDGSVIERLPGCAKTGPVSLASYPELLMEYPSACNKICRRTLFIRHVFRSRCVSASGMLSAAEAGALSQPSACRMSSGPAPSPRAQIFSEIWRLLMPRTI